MDRGWEGRSDQIVLEEEPLLRLTVSLPAPVHHRGVESFLQVRCRETLHVQVPTQLVPSLDHPPLTPLLIHKLYTRNTTSERCRGSDKELSTKLKAFFLNRRRFRGRLLTPVDRFFHPPPVSTHLSEHEHI